MAKVSLPSVTSPLPPDMRAFVQRVREAFSQLDEVVITREELERVRLIGITPGGSIIPGDAIGGTVEEPDYTPPPAPTGFSASGALATIILDWDEPPYSFHGFTEIWRATTDSLGSAVRIGTTDASVYSDAVGNTGVTYFYWIRFVSKWDVVGPYNATAGTPAATVKVLGPDVAAGSVTATHLSTTLGSRIDLIDAPASISGSVNQRIQVESDNLNQQISLLAMGVGGGFDSFVVWYFDTSAESWTASNGTLAFNAGWLKLTATAADPQFLSPTGLGVQGSKYASIKTRVRRTGTPTWDGTLWYRRTGDSTWDAARSLQIPEPLWSDNMATVTWDMSQDTTWTGGTIDRIRIDISSNSGSVIDLDYVSVGREGPAASVAALQTEATIRQQADNQFAIQYTVKLDNNGYVSGYGLASTPVNGVPYSSFVIRSDSFVIASSSGPGITPVTPFTVVTTPYNNNGVSVPIGIYMTDAFIQNGAIVTAKIGDLAVDTAKITDLAVTEAKIADLAVTNAKIGGYIQSNDYTPGSTGWHINKNGDVELNNAVVRGGIWAGAIASTAGLTIGAGGSIKGGATSFSVGTGFWIGYDDGNYKLRAGVPGSSGFEWTGSAFNVRGPDGSVTISSGVVDWSKIAGTGKPQNGATVGATFGDYNGAGGNISGTITPGNVTTFISNAAIGNAQIGGDIYSDLWNSSGNTQGWYLQRNGNLYCANAYVRGDVVASSLKANTLMVNNANIVNGAVDTLKIAGNAATVSASSSGAGTISASLYVPSGQYMEIIGIGYVAPQSNITTSWPMYAKLTLAGNSVAEAVLGTPNSSTYNYQSVTQLHIIGVWGPATVTGSLECYRVQPITQEISHMAVTKRLVMLGRMR